MVRWSLVFEELLVSDLIGLVGVGYAMRTLERANKDRGRPCGAFATFIVVFLFMWHCKCLMTVVTCCRECQLQYSNQALLDRTDRLE